MEPGAALRKIYSGCDARTGHPSHRRCGSCCTAKSGGAVRGACSPGRHEYHGLHFVRAKVAPGLSAQSTSPLPSTTALEIDRERLRSVLELDMAGDVEARANASAARTRSVLSRS